MTTLSSLTNRLISAAEVLDEHENYILPDDLTMLEASVKNIEKIAETAETAHEDDTCGGCGETLDDCLCEPEDEEEETDDIPF